MEKVRTKQLDLALGQRLRERGLDQVEEPRTTWAERMRAWARQESYAWGSVTADDVRRFAEQVGDLPDHPNAWGAIFRGSQWKVVGRVASSIPSAHAREIKVWQWQGEGK